MAKIYALPNADEWDQKPGEEFKDFDKRQQSLLDELSKEMEKILAGEKDSLVGYIFCAPYADGQAMYLVSQEKPLELCHIPFMDAWRLPAAHERGLMLKDIQADLSFQKMWRKK
jgi:hypothetical protein